MVPCQLLMPCVILCLLLLLPLVTVEEMVAGVIGAGVMPIVTSLLIAWPQEEGGGPLPL
jgi:hypothetical protein